MTGLRPQRGKLSWKSILGLIAAGLVALSPMAMSDKDPLHKPYRDYAGRLNICYNHKEAVRITDTATTDQCRQLLENDIMHAATGVLERSPALAEHKTMLEASIDFTVSEGLDAYRASPMARHFDEGQWFEGCEAFPTYHIRWTFNHQQVGTECKLLRDGKWDCAVPEMIKRRARERLTCLGKES